MFGAHADSFFLKQKGERVVAQKANGMSNSLNWPERGDKGSQTTYSVPGTYETPGPQNVHMQNSMMPGMGGDMMPGMGQVYDAGRGMLPGMSGDMMPGMGALSDLLTPRNLMIGGGVIAAILFLKNRK